MRKLAHRLLPAVFLISSFCFADSAAVADHQPIVEALQWVRAPLRGTVQYDYILTARVRLIFFWAGKDDVGGGYIRRAVSSDDAREEFFQVLFGSDPEKAPRAINRWGAGTEIAWHRNPATFASAQDDVSASAFFGFMKSSRGKSVGEMQSELKKENEQGLHAFTGILSRVESARAVSTVVPLQSGTDYTLRQYDAAAPVMLDHIQNSDGPVRSLVQRDCARAAAFMATVAELIEASLEGVSAPLSRCYVHDAQENTIKLEKIERLANLAVAVQTAKKTPLLDVTHHDLLQLDFVSTHKKTGKQVNFTVITGTKGPLRGVPVQIRYQPNWWFEVVLNLRPDPLLRPPSTLASR
jgi:hypothetical protein